METTLTKPNPELSEAKRALLNRRISGAFSSTPTSSTIPVRNSNLAPLSFAQERLWFLDQLQPNSSLYVMPLAVRLVGPLNVAALEKVLGQIVARHQILRTCFVAMNGSPVQVVGPSLEFKLQTINADGVSLENIQEQLVAEAERPFDLAKDLMLRATLFRLGENEHALLLSMHHIASDAWSWSIFLRELSELYGAAIEGEEMTLPPLPIQYADYANWECEQFRGGKLEEELAYWRQQLQAAPVLLDLPADHNRPATQSFRGARHAISASRELHERLKTISRREGVTLYLLLITAFKALVHRYTGREDLVIGTPVAGRNETETEPLIGFFVKTLVLRTHLSGGLTFRELLQRVKHVVLDAQAHQDLPFEKIVEELRPARSPGFPPLVQVMFAFQNTPALELSLPGIKTSTVELPGHTAKFDLTLFVDETQGELRFTAEYNTDLFAPATIMRLLQHFETLLEGVTADPEQRISDLPLLRDSERNELLLEWNRTETDYPSDATISELFEEQVDKTPRAIAVEYQQVRLTYQELNVRANQLAHHFQSLGVGPDVFVAVAMARSTELIVALLAILKAGGAYIALDVAQPDERLAAILEDSHPCVLLTEAAFKDRFSTTPTKATVICLDKLRTQLTKASESNPTNQSVASNLAYVSFTSGSTGGPKGVCVPHRGVVRLVKKTDYLQLGETDVVAQISNSAFDASTFEIWGALLNGACLEIFPQTVVLSPKRFKAELERANVTALFVTTALFNQLTQEEPGIFAGIGNVLFGGDTVNARRVAQVLKEGRPSRLLHVYGPTESTTFTTWHEVREVLDSETTVPIGRPIANTEVFVLDQNLQPVPIGVPGELYIAGDGLALGYLNRPEVTTTKFISHPFSKEPGARLYRTGDIVRFRADRNLEFIGRTDLQIKLRGFRVELGEIEAALSQHPGIVDCAVVLDSGDATEKRLLAYVVSNASTELTEDDLRMFLRGKLPDYMLPSLFVFISAMPLNANGKINRAALRGLDIENMRSGRQFVAPRDAIETQLGQIWQDLLETKPVGATDNFFDLGGHSLLAIRLLARVEKEMGKSLPVATLFESPTLGEFAKAIKTAGKTMLSEGNSLMPIQPNGSKPPLFLVHGAGGGMFWGYTNLAKYLGEDQPVYAFRSRGLDGLTEFDSIREMAAAYITSLRAFQPNGPYCLGGYCFGGNVAYEMACQLQAAGETVSILALMNSIPPDSRYRKASLSFGWLKEFFTNVSVLLKWHFGRTRAQRRDYVKWQMNTLRGKMRRFLGWGSTGQVNASELVDLSACTADERSAWDAHVEALFNHRTQPYGGEVILLRSRGHQFWCSFNSAYGWRQFVKGNLRVQIIEGAHEQILEEPFVPTLASKLKCALNMITQDPPPRITNGTTSVSELPVTTNGHATDVLPPAEENNPRVTFGSGQELTLPSLQVSDGAAVSNGHLPPEQEKAQLDYWLTQLRNAPSILELPTDRPRPTHKSDASARLSFELPGTLVTALGELSQAENTTLFATLFAAFQVLLNRYTGSTDLVIGSTAPKTPEAENMVGQFENLLVLRGDLSGDPTFRDLLRRTTVTIADAWANRTLPFERILAALQPERDPQRHPIFQVLFQFDEEPLPTSFSAHARFTPEEIDNHTSKLMLTLRLVRSGTGIAGSIEYSTDLFDADRIVRMAEHFRVLLTGSVAMPDQSLSCLPLLTENERQQLVKEWNQTELDYPRAATLTSLFEEQAQRTPDAIALIAGGEHISYHELNARANQLAHYLRGAGVQPETLVGLCVERSWRMLVGILGILKAGGAYVPMDPAYPKDRLEFMLADAEAPVLVTQQNLRNLFNSANDTGVSRKVVCLDTDWNFIAASSSENLKEGANPENLAYVIYTSGSTGKPKGVAIEHRAPVALLYWARETFSQAERAGVLGATSMCFDLSIFEMFMPLSWGGTLILADNAIGLATLPEASKVTLVNTVPSAIRELLRVKGVPASVRVINLAGEPLTTALADQIYDETSVVKVYDLYGPTETTTYSTGTLRRRSDAPTIGRPLANEQVYIFDSKRQLQPIGVPGELYIGGDGLAREYLHRPELTAERFVPHPFCDGARLYRTGDLARWRADGNLEFLGRMDHQVKIRGFRIELGEIESALRQNPEIAEAIVVAQECQNDDKQLAAYIVVRAASHLSVGTLREFLKQRVPEYMVPTHIIFLEALPLTPNGKVDRKSLPKIQPTRQAEDECVLPRTPVETSLVAIWREVLGVDKIGIHDNFFELGGHSLLAIQVVSRIRAELSCEVPLHALFDQPTIATLAEGIVGGELTQQSAFSLPLRSVPREGSLPVSFVQERLWVLAQLDPESSAYNVPVAIRIKGVLNTQALERGLDEIVRRHEALRTIFRIEGENVTQVIQQPSHLPITRMDGRAHPEAERESEARRLVAAEVRKPFDLAQGPLVRAMLVQLEEEDHIFCLVMHHTVSDGWSLAILFKELEALYDAHRAGSAAPTLPDLEIQCADHANWQRQNFHGEALNSELDWWKNTLAGAPSSVQLPHDSIANTSERDGAQVMLRLSERFDETLNTFCHQHQSTPFMTCLTALAITLKKWTRQNDLVVGTVVAGRNSRELEKVIGCFMNFLPLRIKLDEPQTGAEMLSQTRSVVLNAQAHQECPFQKIVEAVNPKRRTDQNPLYNVALLLQNFPTRLFQSENLDSQVMTLETETALLDLRFEVEEVDNKLVLRCEYRTSLFTAETAHQLLTSYQQVLETLIAHPETKLSEFQITPELAAKVGPVAKAAEAETVAVTATFTAEFLAEPFQYWMKQLESPAEMKFAPYGQVFQELLDANSLLARNQTGLNAVLVRLEDWERPPAFESNGSGHGIELDQKLEDFILALKSASNRGPVPYLVCFCPSGKGLQDQPERVAFFESTENQFAARLRLLNNVYVVTTAELFDLYPVVEYYDPRGDELGHVPYTPAFFTALATMIARRYHALKQPPCKVIALDCDHTLWGGVCGEDGPNGINLDPPRLALQEFMRDQLDSGRLLCLCSKNNEEDVAAVFERKQMPLRSEHFVTRQINWSPKSINLRAMADELKLGLESIVLVDDNPMECAEVTANCPEAVTLQLPEDPALIPQFLKHCWIFDQPRKTTEDARRTELYQQNHRRETLRKESLSFTDFLAALELEVEIATLTAENLARVAQLTQRTNQFNTTTHRLNEGELQRRVECEGYEVRTVQVSDRFGDYGLVGVIIFKSEGSWLTVDSLLLSCRVLGKGVEHRMIADLGRLCRDRGLEHVNVHFTPSAKNKPAKEFLDGVVGQFRQAQNGGFVYAIPVQIAERIAFQPVQSNESVQTSLTQPALVPVAGKNTKRFDRWRWIAMEANDPVKILEQIDAKGRRQAHGAVNGAPTSNLEKQLCEVWQELLRLERVGIHDDFFELGGHSFLAVRLFTQIEKLTGKRLPVVSLFQSPTIAQLAERIAATTLLSDLPSLIVPIQPKGERPPLFLVHGAGGDVMWGYANLARHLGTNQPVFGIQARATDAPDKFETLEEMAADYVDVLRGFWPDGPYCLGGYCFGGNLAYEMARQLRAQNQEVTFLALVESTPEGGTYERLFWWRPDFLFRFARNFYFWLNDFLGYTSEERRSLVRRKFKVFTRKIASRFGGERTGNKVDLDAIIDTAKFPEHEIKLWRAHIRLLEGHVSKPYDGHVTVLRTAAHPLFSSYQQDLGWSPLVRQGVTVKVVAGSHGNIFLEPNVGDLGRNLTSALDNLMKQATTPAKQTLQTA